MKTYDISRLPNTITLGYDGENNWRPQAFDCTSLLANHPDGIITLWLLPKGEAQAFPVALERDGNTVTWTPLSEEMTVRTGALQIVCTDGTDVGKSRVAMFHVDESILPGADHPAAVPSWATQTVERAEDAADRAEAAAESIDIDALEAQIAEAVEDYLIEHPVQAPVQSVNGKTGAVVLDASDVGALPENTPIPPTVTVDSALSDSSENPVQNKVVKEALDAKYSKPSGGIPTSDLNLVGLGTWLDNAGATIYTLSLSGTTVTLDESFLAFYYMTDSARHTLFVLPIGGTEQQPIVLEMYLVHVDAQNYTITLACVYNGNRYSVTLSAASAITSPMTGTLVVETIVTVSDIPTAVSELTNDSGFQTASQVQAAIAAIPSELPSVSSTDNSKFLRVVDGAWAAQAVPAAEGSAF